MTAVIRPAKREDCRILAYHAYLAGKSNVDTSVYDVFFAGIPGPTDARLSAMEKLLQTDTVSWMHYTFCSVAEVEGTVAGSLSHYHARDGAYANLGKALFEIGWDEEQGAGMAARMKPLLDIDFPKPPEALIVENVAVTAMYRRHGVISALLKDAARLGREGGFEFLQLGMMIGNTPAEKAYQKAGFEVVDSHRSPEFEELFECPGMQLMKLDLA